MDLEIGDLRMCLNINVLFKMKIKNLCKFFVFDDIFLLIELGIEKRICLDE